ncbi:hypothetical protein Tco_0900600 [Tanacetum coccineum]
MSAKSEFNDSESSVQISTHTPPSPPPSPPPLVPRSPPLVMEIAFSAMRKEDTSHSTKMLRYDMLLSSTQLIVYSIVSGMIIKQKYRKATTSDL